MILLQGRENYDGAAKFSSADKTESQAIRHPKRVPLLCYYDERHPLHDLPPHPSGRSLRVGRAGRTRGIGHAALAERASETPHDAYHALRAAGAVPDGLRPGIWCDGPVGQRGDQDPRLEGVEGSDRTDGSGNPQPAGPVVPLAGDARAAVHGVRRYAARGLRARRGGPAVDGQPVLAYRTAHGVRAAAILRQHRRDLRPPPRRAETRTTRLDRPCHSGRSRRKEKCPRHGIPPDELPGRRQGRGGAGDPRRRHRR